MAPPEIQRVVSAQSDVDTHSRMSLSRYLKPSSCPASSNQGLVNPGEGWKRSEDIDPASRELLVRALASGLFAAGGAFGFRAACAQPLGKVPKPLPAGRSFYEVSGPVLVNGKAATLATQVGVNDTVETGKAAQAIFVVGSDAFILRANSRLELKGRGVFANQLRLVTGALLSVFGKGPRSVSGSTSTIGIRGTGLYLEAQPDLELTLTQPLALHLHWLATGCRRRVRSYGFAPWRG